MKTRKTFLLVYHLIQRVPKPKWTCRESCIAERSCKQGSTKPNETSLALMTYKALTIFNGNWFGRGWPPPLRTQCPSVGTSWRQGDLKITSLDKVNLNKVAARKKPSMLASGSHQQLPYLRLLPSGNRRQWNVLEECQTCHQAIMTDVIAEGFQIGESSLYSIKQDFPTFMFLLLVSKLYFKNFFCSEQTVLSNPNILLFYLVKFALIR